MTYFTAIDRCLQDMASVLSIFEYVLKQVKQDLPNLNTLYTRSDNAGCYAGATVILSRPEICSRFGICLKRTEFSEPQRGKDQADRDIAVAKSCLKAYTNRGGNLTNAESIKEALDQSFGSLSGSKTCVNIRREYKLRSDLYDIDNDTATISDKRFLKISVPMKRKI